MKVHTLALGTGYAEDASWASLLLTHEDGFDTVQDALINLRQHFLQHLLDHQGYGGAKVHINCATCKCSVEGPTDDDIEIFVHDFIHGDLQFGSEMYERLTDDVWHTIGMSGFDPKNMVLLDRSPQLIGHADKLVDPDKVLLMQRSESQYGVFSTHYKLPSVRMKFFNKGSP
jgi:hypothetical protein